MIVYRPLTCDNRGERNPGHWGVRARPAPQKTVSRLLIATSAVAAAQGQTVALRSHSLGHSSCGTTRTAVDSAQGPSSSGRSCRTTARLGLPGRRGRRPSHVPACHSRSRTGRCWPHPWSCGAACVPPGSWCSRAGCRAGRRTCPRAAGAVRSRRGPRGCVCRSRRPCKWWKFARAARPGSRSSTVAGSPGRSRCSSSRACLGGAQGRRRAEVGGYIVDSVACSLPPAPRPRCRVVPPWVPCGLVAPGAGGDQLGQVLIPGHGTADDVVHMRRDRRAAVELQLAAVPVAGQHQRAGAPPGSGAAASPRPAHGRHSGR